MKEGPGDWLALRLRERPLSMSDCDWKGGYEARARNALVWQEGEGRRVT